MHESNHCNHKLISMDKRDEEILELKQKLIDLMKENNEMKELILFLDDERNYARQFVRDFNNKQSLNWNSLKQKLSYLEQKQFELIKENYSLKQLCVLLDDNSNSAPLLQTPQSRQSNDPSNPLLTNNSKSLSSICQYILNLENELKSHGIPVQRPKYVHDLLKLNSIRETTTSTSSSNGHSTEEKSIIYSLSETAIKSIFNR